MSSNPKWCAYILDHQDELQPVLNGRLFDSAPQAHEQAMVIYESVEPDRVLVVRVQRAGERCPNCVQWSSWSHLPFTAWDTCHRCGGAGVV